MPKERSAFQQALLAYWIENGIAEESRWAWDFTRSFLAEMPTYVIPLLHAAYYDAPLSESDVRLLAKHGFAATGRKIGATYSV